MFSVDKEIEYCLPGHLWLKFPYITVIQEVSEVVVSSENQLTKGRVPL